jgi:hypothetical protein
MEDKKPDRKNEKVNLILSLEKVNKNLETAADALESAFFHAASTKKTEEASGLLRAVEENLKLIVLLLRKMNEEVRKSRGHAEKGAARSASSSGPLFTESEARKLFPGKKNIVYYHNSDFVSLEEYIEHMRRPPISNEEATAANWDRFMEDLNNWGSRPPDVC